MLSDANQGKVLEDDASDGHLGHLVTPGLVWPDIRVQRLQKPPSIRFGPFARWIGRKFSKKAQKLGHLGRQVIPKFPLTIYSGRITLKIDRHKFKTIFVGDQGQIPEDDVHDGHPCHQVIPRSYVTRYSCLVPSKTSNLKVWALSEVNWLQIPEDDVETEPFWPPGNPEVSTDHMLGSSHPQNPSIKS